MVLNKMKNDGIRKSKLTIDQLIILSVMSGLFIGFAGTFALFTAGNCKTMEIDNPGLNKFFFGAVFPIGLILVIMLGTELFTGNNLVLLIGFFSRKWRNKKIGLHYLQVSKNLLISFVFNVLGAALFAYLFVYLVQPTSDAHWVTTVKNIAVAKVAKSFGQIVLLAIVCNMMVTLAVFITNAATTVEGKIIGAWLPIMAFAATGFEHSIANTFFIPLAMMYGADVTAYQFLIDNLLPSTIGNIIGGSIVVGCFFYYVHDFRSNHPRIVFNLIEKMYAKLKMWFLKRLRQELPVVDEENKEQREIEMQQVDSSAQMV
ncbi:predicted protein [Naegleria gruberi]|uniref:Predicted protein n=1 Tax=Naegleria gruberi TaxID=5762 RepID=D2UYJ1_NAEGR|nr:uncharacterized protein NAEGRDRAFT_55063 [Naegleria gruberi]EFC50483.1 predicted protein [Naegleria gruberi]|eukprot:XP_002683227.1 predicted protein [Naegleria gruberi strain NEG-M]